MPVPERWSFALRIPLLLIAVGLFFHLYNRFILDAHLEDLKTSLSTLDAAEEVGQAEATLLLMDQTLIAQMAQEEVDPEKLAALQFAQGTLASDTLDRPVADSRLMVASLTTEETAKRPTVLTALDGVVTGVQKALQRAALAGRQLLGGPTIPTLDDDRLKEAVRLERVGSLPEAARLYEAILLDHPYYAGRARLQLRLGYLYHRLGLSEQAESLYRQALEETRDLQEASAARRMLAILSAAGGKQEKIQMMEDQLAALGAGPQRQQLAFKLGSALIELYDFDRAARVFREAVSDDPKGEWAPAALFKEGWCLRNSGRLEEALHRFVGLLRSDATGHWSDAAYAQIAEIYRATGDSRTAAAIYEEAARQVQDPSLAALLHAQAGSIYRYDLKDIERAKAHFTLLSSRFPASRFGDAPKRLEQMEVKKPPPAVSPPQPTAPLPLRPAAPPQRPGTSLPPARAEGSPVIGWLEQYLPSFADIFMERLTHYMQATGKTTLSRKFTEDEFRDLVVRRLEERFPKQISGFQARIRPDGFVGSGKVTLGALTFPVSARIGVQVIEEKPYAVIHEIRVGNLALPEPLRKLLEDRVNRSIEQAEYPLKVKAYTLHKGYAQISVELEPTRPLGLTRPEGEDRQGRTR